MAQMSVDGGTNSNSSLQILDNGAGSRNTLSAKLSDQTALNQNNSANVRNGVDVHSTTGNNHAGFNTGDGSVVIDTGSTTANVSVDNAVNFNAADVDSGYVYGLTAKISGNGADVGEGLNSNVGNKISANLSNMQNIGQGNNATLNNDLSGREGVDSHTGNNFAGFNTSGKHMNNESAVRTGDANSTVNVGNSGNQNLLGKVNLPQMDFNWDFSALWSFFGMFMHN